LHSPDGAALGQVQMKLSNELGQMGAAATLPDGETFTGAVQPLAVYSSGNGFVTTPEGTASVTTNETYSSDLFEGVLIGDRGNSMQCRMHGTLIGGSGQCVVSDGRKVAVQW
jgi:hypothetical protein